MGSLRKRPQTNREKEIEMRERVSECVCALPVVLCGKVRVANSSVPENDVIYACAWVPFTGILNSFPANTFDVPSKPPENHTYSHK